VTKENPFLVGVLVSLLLPGCASLDKAYDVQAVSNQLIPDMTLYSKEGIQVMASLQDVDSTVKDGYRTERLIWRIYAANHNKSPRCVEVDFSAYQYDVQAYPVVIRGNGVATVAKLLQQYDGLVDFDYVSDSFFQLSNVECRKP
jgi:hypothetical protein